MTTRVAHIGDVCEWGGCERRDPKRVDGWLLCPPHAREHEEIVAAPRVSRPVVTAAAPRITASHLQQKRHEIHQACLAMLAANRTGFTPEQLTSPSQRQDLHAARTWLMYQMRVELDASLPVIGRVFNRHHTTVLAALNRLATTGLELPATTQLGAACA